MVLSSRDASEKDVGNIEGSEREIKGERRLGGKQRERKQLRRLVLYLSRTFGSVQTPAGNNYLDPYIYLHVITLHPRLASSSRDLINM